MSESVVVIRCRENGPYVIHGTIRLVDHLGNELPTDSEKANLALCRCGQSNNRPFCDGSHRVLYEASEETTKE